LNIPEYRVDDEDKSLAQAYREKRLLKYYRRKIEARRMSLSREEAEKKYGAGEFFHLNTHTKFSPLSGISSPYDLFNHAADLGMPGLAVTEVGYMSSIPDCWQAAKDTGLKFITGVCMHVSDYEEKRREIVSVDKRLMSDHPALVKACKPYMTPRITVIAKNQEGYKELVQLNAETWEHGYYYIPKVTRTMLKKYANGNLIILSGTLPDKFIELGYISDIDNPEYGALSARGYLEWFHEYFGNDFYAEIVMSCVDTVWGSDLDKMTTMASLLYQMEKDGKKINTIVTNDSFYLNREDQDLYRALVAIGRNSTIRRTKEYSAELYLKTRAELRATFEECYYNKVFDRKQFEESCDKTLEVSEQCEAFFANTDPKLPSIDDAAEKLKKLVAVQLHKRGLHKNTTKYEIDGKMVTYVEQVKIELDRFISKGFESYFLIMRDIIGYSHKLGWQTGPARGSAGGSLVCYLLGITSMDPIKFDLSFDRFLSPSRGGYMLKVSMD
jgi:DNA polymerase-3 subunit alpha